MMAKGKGNNNNVGGNLPQEFRSRLGELFIVIIIAAGMAGTHLHSQGAAA